MRGEKTARPFKEARASFFVLTAGIPSCRQDSYRGEGLGSTAASPY